MRFARRSSLGVVALAAIVAAVACSSDPVVREERVPEGFEPGAAFGILAQPGPSPRSITLRWAPVEDAGEYAIYYSTTPGVTPLNGTRILGASSGYVHYDLIAGETYHYIVAGINRDFEGAPSAEVAATPHDGVTLDVQQPGAGAFVGGQLDLVVGVIATDALTSLVAATSGVTAPLAFNPVGGIWSGALAIGALESPTLRKIRVTATDVGGQISFAEAIVRLDHPPVVVVTSPAEGAIASPTLRITATCTDDGRLGCTEFIAFIPGSRGTPLAGGTAAMDATASLAAFGAGEMEIVIEGRDSQGQITRVVRRVRRE